MKTILEHIEQDMGHITITGGKVGQIWIENKDGEGMGLPVDEFFREYNKFLDELFKKYM
jgi:hypothetical protein